MEADFSGLGFPAEKSQLSLVSSGIGRSHALTLARSGVTVSAWDINDEMLDALMGDIEKAGGQGQQSIGGSHQRRGDPVRLEDRQWNWDFPFGT